MGDFRYFRIADGVPRSQRFVRVDSESVNAEFEQMRKDGQLHSKFVFHGDSARHDQNPCLVDLGLLREVHGARLAVLMAQWSDAEHASVERQRG